VGTRLFTRSLLKLTSNDPGFRAEHMVAFDLDPSLSGYSSERSMALFRDLRDRLHNLPGVTAVTNAEFAPFGGFGWGSGVKLPGSHRTGEEFAACSQNSIGPGYFSTFGIPLLEGREFTAQDSEHAPKVAILNQTFARVLFEKLRRLII